MFLSSDELYSLFYKFIQISFFSNFILFIIT